MAFPSVLLLSGLFSVLAGAVLFFLLSAAVLLVLALVFALLHRRAKRRVARPSPWRKVLSLLCLVLALLALLIPAGLLRLTGGSGTEEIETAGGTVTVEEQLLTDYVHALQEDDAEALASLLDRQSALLDYRTFEGYYPVNAAIRYEAPRCLRLLLERGAQPDREGNSPSVWFVFYHHAMGGAFCPDLIAPLLEYGADVNTAGGGAYDPPLSCLVSVICADGDISQEELDLARAMTGAGADREAPDREGMTPARALEQQAQETPALAGSPLYVPLLELLSGRD